VTREVVVGVATEVRQGDSHPVEERVEVPFAEGVEVEVGLREGVKWWDTLGKVVGEGVCVDSAVTLPPPHPVGVACGVVGGDKLPKGAVGDTLGLALALSQKVGLPVSLTGLIDMQAVGMPDGVGDGVRDTRATDPLAEKDSQDVPVGEGVVELELAPLPEPLGESLGSGEVEGLPVTEAVPPPPAGGGSEGVPPSGVGEAQGKGVPDPSNPEGLPVEDSLRVADPVPVLTPDTRAEREGVNEETRERVGKREGVRNPDTPGDRVPDPVGVGEMEEGALKVEDTVPTAQGVEISEGLEL
jgi:hypothetical protein